jgi:hypothetical protein
MKNYQTIEEIVKQLEFCSYECEGGVLVKNIAFERLKKIANSNYQPKFFINELVYYKDKPYYIHGISVSSQTHPNTECLYELSEEFNRQSTTNKFCFNYIKEAELLTVEAYKANQIAKAKELLKENGITTV